MNTLLIIFSIWFITFHFGIQKNALLNTQKPELAAKYGLCVEEALERNTAISVLLNII